MKTKFLKIYITPILALLVFVLGGVVTFAEDVTPTSTVNEDTNTAVVADAIVAPPVFPRHLGYGSKGNDVMLLQKYLKQMPEIYPEGFVTGYFGPLTKAAVKRYQKANGIIQTGIAGVLTRGVLNETVKIDERGDVVKKDTPAVADPADNNEPTSDKTESSAPTPSVTPTPIVSVTPTPAISVTPTPTPTPTTDSAGGGGGGSVSATPISIPVLEQCSMTLASGNQIYFMRTQSMPQLMRVDINPLDALVGASQSFTVQARDTNNVPITAMQVQITGDGGVVQSTFALALTSGTATNGTWSGSWTVAGSRCSNFTVRVSATSTSGTSFVDISLK